MQIFIPTYGRSDYQVTWDNLPHAVKFSTKLVVQERERHKYEKYPTVVLPPEIQSIGPTRQWILDHATDSYIIMLDDDLDFATRREDEPAKFRGSTDGDTYDMIYAILEQLHLGYKLVGVSGREGANRDTSAIKYATRQLRIHGINRVAFKELGIRFDRIPFMEDFDVTLQLLEQGHTNCVLNQWVHNQRGGSNAPGGCSESRTAEAQSAAAKELKRLHPSVVRLVEKTTGDWGMGTRLDVYVEWKKALRMAEAKKEWV